MDVSDPDDKFIDRLAKVVEQDMRDRGSHLFDSESWERRRQEDPSLPSAHIMRIRPWGKAVVRDCSYRLAKSDSSPVDQIGEDGFTVAEVDRAVRRIYNQVGYPLRRSDWPEDRTVPPWQSVLDRVRQA